MLLHLPEFLKQMTQSSYNKTVFMSAKDHWQTFHAAVREWISHHEPVNSPTSDIRQVWKEAWNLRVQHLGSHWTVRELQRRIPGLGTFGIMKALTLTCSVQSNTG